MNDPAKAQVEQMLRDRYGLTLDDVDEDFIDQALGEGDSPEGIIEYLAEKFDLTPMPNHNSF